MSIYFNFGRMTGFVFGLVLGLIICVFLFRVLRGKWGIRSQYDERQKAARGTAYAVGFWTLMGYLCLWFVLEDIGLPLPHSSVMLAVGMMLALAVQACISIWKDAYYGIYDKPKRFLLTLAVVDAYNLGIYILITRHNLVGDSSLPILLLATLILGVLVLITYGLRTFVRKVEDREDME